MVACGFKLAGTSDLPESLDTLHLSTENMNVQQRDRLISVLQRAGASLTAAEQAKATLSVNLKPLRQQTVVSSASSGNTIQQLTRELEYRVAFAGLTETTAMRTLRQRKNFQNDEDNLLSSRVQKSDVIRDLELSLFNQLVFQLQRY